MEGEIKQLERLLEIAREALVACCEDKWYEYCPQELLNYFGLDEYGEPLPSAGKSK